MYRQYTIVPCFYTYVRMYFDRRLHEAATLFTDQIVMMKHSSFIHVNVGIRTVHLFMVFLCISHIFDIITVFRTCKIGLYR